MAITVNNKYSLSSIVYIKTDNESLPRQVVAIKIYVDGSYQYEVVSGTVYSHHFECELCESVEIASEAIGG